MANQRLLTQTTKFAFLVRLASLVLIFYAPGATEFTLIGMIVVLFVATTSALGLYRNAAIVRSVSAHPILVSLDVLIASVIMIAAGPTSPILFYTLSTALLIGLLLTKRVAIPLLVTLIVCYFFAVQVAELQLDTATGLLLPLMYVVLSALGLLIRSLFDATSREHERSQQLAIEAAGAGERARLAREMHDSVAKSLHGIGLAAAALPSWIRSDPTLAASKAEALQHAAEMAAKQARTVLVNLRQDGDDRSLTELLRQCVEDANGRSTTQTALAITGIADCDFEIRRQIAAITAEALENVIRHSNATHANVECNGSETAITVNICDDGVGFAPAARREGHFGLAGMSERAALLGGELSVRSANGSGTIITATVPRQGARSQA